MSETQDKIITDDDQDNTTELNLRLKSSEKDPYIREAGWLQFLGAKGAYLASVPLSLIVNRALASYLGAELQPRVDKGSPYKNTSEQTYMQKIPRKINDMINARVIEDKSNRSAVVKAALKAYPLSHAHIYELIEAYQIKTKTKISKEEILETAVRNYIDSHQ